MRYNATQMEYRAIAEIRFLIRRFLKNTDKVAAAAGLEPQQYMLLLQLRGLQLGQKPTIGKLAERMQLRNHSVSELIHRMEKRGLLLREGSENDRRCVLLRISPRGERLLDHIVRNRIAELRTTGKELVRSLSVVFGQTARPKGSR